VGLEHDSTGSIIFGDLVSTARELFHGRLDLADTDPLE
jgi:hypothetical protein